MSDYPRDLVNKAGEVKEFKRREDVPPGWFVRDTGEEVNPQEVPVPEDLKPKKISKAAMREMAQRAAEAAAEEPKADDADA